jgi:HEAT repeat protein
VLGLAGESLFQRLDAVKALGKELSAEETTALSAFLRTRPQGDRPKLDGEAALRNDVMNTLRYQLHPPEGLTELFISLYHERAQDEVMRDYAVQHLVSWYEQLADDTEKRRIRDVFAEALSETDSSIAGMALLGMHNLSAAHPEFATPELAAAALRLARDEAASELVRITALQVSAGRGVAGALPEALRLAETAPTVPLQISAIAAVGALGTAEQRPLLEQLAAGPELRLCPAAQTALKRLELRLAQASVPPTRN